MVGIETQHFEFSVEEAISFSEDGRIEGWVHAFLNGPGRNPELSAGLKLIERFWRGPIEIDLSNLVKCCGPGLEFDEPEEAWERRTDEISRKLDEGVNLPPLIAQYRDGELSLRDGNHRCGGLEKAGVERYWVIIWYDSELDYNEHEIPK